MIPVHNHSTILPSSLFTDIQNKEKIFCSFCLHDCRECKESRKEIFLFISGKISQCISATKKNEQQTSELKNKI